MAIHVGNLGVIARHRLSYFRRVRQVGRNLNRRRIVLGGIAAIPWRVRLVGSEYEAPWRTLALPEKGLHAIHIEVDAVLSGVVLPPFEVLEGKLLDGRIVRLVGQSDSIAQGLQMMRQGLHPRVDFAVIRVGPIADRMDSRVQGHSRRSAHRGGVEAGIQAQSAIRQRIDVRRLNDLVSIATDIVIGQVVAQEYENIGRRIRLGHRQTAKRQGKRVESFGEEVFEKAHGPPKQA